MNLEDLAPGKSVAVLVPTKDGGSEVWHGIIGKMGRVGYLRHIEHKHVIMEPTVLIDMDEDVLYLESPLWDPKSPWAA